MPYRLTAEIKRLTKPNGRGGGRPFQIARSVAETDCAANSNSEAEAVRGEEGRDAANLNCERMNNSCSRPERRPTNQDISADESVPADEPNKDPAENLPLYSIHPEFITICVRVSAVAFTHC